MKRYRIGIFGGTFDPLHTGHLRLAAIAAREFRLDRVYFVPTRFPPHKNRPATPARHRISMLRRALRGNKQFRVSDYELRRRGVSYTVRTLEYFTRIYPGSELYLILGQDNAAEFHTWREPERILDLASLIILRRGKESVSRALHGRVLSKARSKIWVLTEARFNISSSEIREKLSQGRTVTSLIPESVERYIRQHKLYGTNGHKRRNQ